MVDPLPPEVIANKRNVALLQTIVDALSTTPWPSLTETQQTNVAKIVCNTLIRMLPYSGRERFLIRNFTGHGKIKLVGS